MKVLIVHAHNEPKSFNTALKDLAVDVLTRQGHDVDVSDLYAMGFNPVAGPDDFLSRVNDDYLVYALEQRNAHEAGTLAPDIAAELDKVKAADLIIFNFPIYWFGMPAILKGWIDRVFVSGHCYGGRRIYDRGGLVGKRAMLSITLGGRDHMFGPDAIHGDLDDMLRPILQGALAYVGLSVLPSFVGYHIPYVDDAERRDCLARYEAHLSTLDERPALRFPSLDDFDDRFFPKGSPSA